MNTTHSSPIAIKTGDYNRLMTLVENADSAAAQALEQELARAEIVPDAAFPPTVVAMDSRVTFVDLDTGDTTTVTLVYPRNADVAAMKISILSPVGSALIGLSIGGIIHWPLPGGKVRNLQVTGVSRSEDGPE